MMALMGDTALCVAMRTRSGGLSGPNDVSLGALRVCSGGASFSPGLLTRWPTMTQKLSVKGRKPIVAGEQNALLCAVRFDHRDKWGANQWLFMCDCGNEHVTRPDWVRLGKVKSCGCYRDEQLGMRSAISARTHGHSANGKLTSEYNSWRNMRDRCFHPNSEKFPHYGGRGITVCERWAKSFENFLADMGPAPKGHTIDRKDVNGNYEPDNCKWSTQKEQMRNTTKTRTVLYLGRDMSLAEACELSGLPRSRVNARLRAGWTVERVFSEEDGRKS